MMGFKPDAAKAAISTLAHSALLRGCRGKGGTLAYWSVTVVWLELLGKDVVVEFCQFLCGLGRFNFGSQHDFIDSIS